NPGGVFTIDANTGEITVADITRLDVESNPLYELIVQVSDGTYTSTSTITVNILLPGSSPPTQEAPGTEEPVQEDEDEKPNHTPNNSNDDPVITIPLFEEPMNNNSNVVEEINYDLETHHFDFFYKRPLSDSMTDGSAIEAIRIAERMNTNKDQDFSLPNKNNEGMWNDIDLMKHQMQGKAGQVESLEKQSDRIFAGVITGFATLIAGYVGWTGNIISLLIGFFTSSPLWKSFDPVPIFDVTKDDEKYWKSNKIEEQDQETIVDSFFDHKTEHHEKNRKHS
ncbi:MAG: cadherin repeat domain-containing protein, partial [Desulfatitalea sp.]|nr:cadherin repeat domain-containing protein [Desulfatitalea sp.]